MAEFGALWVGEPLTKIQVLSLSSFVYHGHTVYLYVYDDSLDVPQGVIKRDAREVFPEEELFLVDGSYAAFSDIFRYEMINKTGLVWADTDTICLKDVWDFKDGIFCGKELPSNMATGSVLGLQPGSEILNYLIRTSQATNRTRMRWGVIGPELVNKAFIEFGLEDYVYPPEVFCGVAYMEWFKLWEPEYLEEVLKAAEVGTALSVYNHMCSKNKVDKGALPPGSAMEYFYNKFVK